MHNEQRGGRALKFRRSLLTSSARSPEMHASFLGGRGVSGGCILIVAQDGRRRELGSSWVGKVRTLLVYYFRLWRGNYRS